MHILEDVLPMQTSSPRYDLATVWLGANDAALPDGNKSVLRCVEILKAAADQYLVDLVQKPSSEYMHSLCFGMLLSQHTL